MGRSRYGQPSVCRQPLDENVLGHAAFARDKRQQRFRRAAVHRRAPRLPPVVKLGRRRVGDRRDEIFYRAKSHECFRFGCFRFNSESRKKVAVKANKFKPASANGNPSRLNSCNLRDNSLFRRSKMKQFATITVIGRDKTGVIARVTNFLFEQHANIEALEEQVTRGQFSMTLQASWKPAD